MPKKEDFSVTLKELEREQRKHRRRLEQIEERKTKKIGDAKEAKRTGKDELCKDIFRELREIEFERDDLSKDLNRLSLEKLAITRVSRKLLKLEQGKDRNKLPQLLAKIKEKMPDLDKVSVDEEVYMEFLNDILEEEKEALDMKTEAEDEGYREFERTLEDMISAEDEAGEDFDDEEFVKKLDKTIKKEPDKE